MLISFLELARLLEDTRHFQNSENATGPSNVWPAKQNPLKRTCPFPRPDCNLTEASELRTPYQTMQFLFEQAHS
jgi:hypothetical protein